MPPFVATDVAGEERADGGCLYWLSDTQINLLEPRRVELTRSVVEVVTPDGLQSAAQFDIDFDPSYEELVFHHVRVIRDGVVREVDPTSGLSIFRRERDLERARYDGRLTAHLVIPDVRVGDVIDVARSTVGADPLLGERFASEWRFSWGCWVGETRVRLLAPAERRFSAQGWNDPPVPQVKELGEGMVERTWMTRNTAPVPSEPDTPGWERTTASVRISDWPAWGEVADLFRGFYEAEPLPRDLEVEFRRTADQAGGSAQLAMALLRLVQGALRYQAVSIGVGGYVPRPLKQIWERRAGDCKDSSRLLAALLDRAGLDAVPCLVHTVRGYALDEEPPSAIAFDHCIVRLRLEGETYWLDPTNFPQGGALTNFCQARYGWSLPLEPGASLEFMGEPPLADTWMADELYELGPDPDSPATLTVKTVFGAWRADGLRRSLANDPSGLVRGYLDYYSRYFGEVEELAPISVHDDAEANQITTIERYRLMQPWEKHPDRNVVEFAVPDDLFAQHLTTSRTATRRRSIDLGLPRFASWKTTIKLPQAVAVSEWDRAFDIPGVRAFSKHSGNAAELKLYRAVTIRSRELKSSESEAFFDLRDAALRSQGVVVSLPVKNGRFAKARQRAQRMSFNISWRLVWWLTWLTLVIGSAIYRNYH
jgi:transglutaminase-like putative cysteine protease